MYHSSNGKEIYLNFMARGKWVKYEVLQDVKELGKLGLLHVKLNFVACLAWWKEWELLINKRPLELEDHELRYGWYGYLWYNKAYL